MAKAKSENLSRKILEKRLLGGKIFLSKSLISNFIKHDHANICKP